VIRHFDAPDGRRLAYRDSAGTGPPVLCLAGLTRNGRDFEALAAHLSPRYRVIRLDSRGRGASERAEVPEDEYTVPVETGDALALLAHLDLPAVTVIGTSRGGILGMAMAAGAAGTVRGLVLNDIGAEIETAALARLVARLQARPRDPSPEAAAVRMAAENAGTFPCVPLGRWHEHVRAVTDTVDGVPVPAHDPALADVSAAATGEAEATVDLWSLFDAAGESPMLVIRGETSDILSRATLARMTARKPSLRTIEIAERGHAPFLDERPALAAIDAFLQEIHA